MFALLVCCRLDVGPLSVGGTEQVCLDLRVCSDTSIHLLAQEEGSGEACTLPLAAEEWADELLGRVFATLGNLDAPAEHRGADAGSGSSAFRGHSFLMSSEQSMFRLVLGCWRILITFSIDE